MAVKGDKHPKSFEARSYGRRVWRIAVLAEQEGFCRRRRFPTRYALFKKRYRG